MPRHFAAIDFGTSNSAIAVSTHAISADAAAANATSAASGVRLVPLEGAHPTMPTAMFYRADTPTSQLEAEKLYGRAAVAAYVDGSEGRLMRSMKSILGTSLLDQSTDIGSGRAVRYRDVVVSYLRQLKLLAEADVSVDSLSRVVLGRPVFFVDDDPVRDAQAQAALEAAARSVGFQEVLFQYEPIAAALDFESGITTEQLVLVADIGGGTSDFSLVRVGPQRARRAERRDDILASHGVHIAGTDFDRHVELATILPLLGYRSRRPPRPGEAAEAAPVVPSSIYFDLASWHLINTVYAPQRVAEVRRMKDWYADPRHHARLLLTLQERLGHALAATAEAAKIDVAQHGSAHMDLSLLERGLACTLATDQAALAIEADLERIVRAAAHTASMAGVEPAEVDALYFTGGSTGLTPLVAHRGAVSRRAAGARRPFCQRGPRFRAACAGGVWG